MSDISVPDLLVLIRFDFQHISDRCIPEPEAIRSWAKYFDEYFQSRELNTCEKILNIAQEFAPHLCESCQARLQFAEGLLHQYRGNWDKAKKCYFRCLELRNSLLKKEGSPTLLPGRKLAVAETLYQLGKLHFDLGNFREAENSYLQALDNIQWSSLEENLEKYLIGLAEAYRIQGKYLLATEKLQEAKILVENKLNRSLNSQVPNDLVIRDQLGMILLSQGLIQYQLGKFKEARLSFEQCAAAIQGTENKVLSATVNHQLGIVHESLGQTDNAMSYYKKTNQTIQELREESRRATGTAHTKADSEILRISAASAHQMGIIYQSQKKYEEAEEEYRSALATWQQVDLQNKLGESQTRHQLGSLFYARAQRADTKEAREQFLSLAREQYAASLKIERENGDNTGEMWTLYQLGLFYQDQGDYPSARENYQNSILMAQQIGDKVAQARGLYQLGLTHQDEGKESTAIEQYGSALKLWGEIGDLANEAQTMYQMATSHQALEEFDQAAKWFTKALSIERELKNQPEAALILLHIGINYHLQDQFDVALGFYRDALDSVAGNNDLVGLYRLIWKLAEVYEKHAAHPDMIGFMKEYLTRFQPDSSQYSILNKYLEHLLSR